MPLPRSAIFSHVTFEGHLDDSKVIGEIVEYVRAAGNGPVNIRLIENDETFVMEKFYVARIEGNWLWIDRRHDHDRRHSEDRREEPRDRQKERRKPLDRRRFDIGHMPKPITIVPPKPTDA